MSERDDEVTRAALDKAIRDHAADDIRADGEVIVSWLVLAAIRRYDGGGAVVSMPSGAVMPYWEARGLLHEALACVDRMAAREVARGED